MGRVERTGDTRRKAKINDTVPGLGVRGKGFLKHGRIDVVGAHIPLRIIQYIVKFFCLNSLAVKIVRFINDHRSRDYVQLMGCDILLRQIGGGIGN